MATERNRQLPVRSSPSAHARFDPQLMHAAATLYYLEDATQAEIAARLGTSRATVSRLLAEARRAGIVRIEVLDPGMADREDLGARTATALGLKAVHLSPPAHEVRLGASLAPQLFAALTTVGMRPGDALLVSSGRTVWEVAQEDLPRLPDVLVTPTVGGQHEPEAWYQTNEITRLVAEKVRGRPVFLHAPALPGRHLHEQILQDPATREVLQLWGTARCAVLGVGAPPLLRRSLPGFVPRDAAWLRDAVGDICTRFYDRTGRPLAFPGSERLVATDLATLQRIPVTIAVAVGTEKVPSLLAGARAGWFNTLVTDAPTAASLLTATQS